MSFVSTPVTWTQYKEYSWRKFANFRYWLFAPVFYMAIKLHVLANFQFNIRYVIYLLSVWKLNAFYFTSSRFPIFFLLNVHWIVCLICANYLPFIEMAVNKFVFVISPHVWSFWCVKILCLLKYQYPGPVGVSEKNLQNIKPSSGVFWPCWSFRHAVLVFYCAYL